MHELHPRHNTIKILISGNSKPNMSVRPETVSNLKLRVPPYYALKTVICIFKKFNTAQFFGIRSL